MTDLVKEAFVPVSVPNIGSLERRYVLECLDEGWVSSDGPWLSRFEMACAKRFGRKYAIAVSNGTVALEAAVAALRLGPGDEVIVPTFTIISCAAAVLRSGATPIFVDADSQTWCIDVNKIEAAITPRTRAILAVHIYGLPCDMARILELGDRYGLQIIEDAAEAHGQTCFGRHCGGFGIISTLSFYANKHVTTGEGGLILTDDDFLADRCRGIRNLFFSTKKRFIHEELGWNYRLGSLAAALGLAQLERLDETIKAKQEIGSRYQEMLSDLPGLRLPASVWEGVENHYWVFGVVLDAEMKKDADQAISHLAEAGLGARPFFWPMHQQPAIATSVREASQGTFPVAEWLGNKGFYVPAWVGMPSNVYQRVRDALLKFLTAT